MEEFHQSISSFYQNQNHGVFTVLLLGQLPLGIKLDLHCIEHVVVFDSDMVPGMDIDSLSQYFLMGVSSVEFVKLH